ncbi:hypothetical protein [Nocardioides mesophilus]|uniref:ATP/GTP-binding protein n=1 Tax=Nocardioides mesophilus TaxID=433659 RepID=A0A7G9R864_9ACTN|nr:hypothetical protein [Nocardioides mesophilus]QNN51789.1 hypothetical protein H9L09_14735 [Nocardioides mesophilus]
MALLLPLLVVAPRAVADGDSQCPPGTNPVSVGSGVICVVVTDPGEPSNPGDPGDPGNGGRGPPVGCYKSDGTEVPCQTHDGTWWSGHQCYAAPYDAPPGTPAWQGHTDGSLWQCTSCTSAGVATTCNVQILWTAPGQEPGPPTPEELAATALGLMPLAMADIRTAPEPPAATYIGVENWLWIPDGQWATLHKSVTAGATTVTVTATPSQTVWDLGPTAVTCYGPGKPWVQGMTEAASTTCAYTYKETSDREPQGQFQISATIRYHVTWSCSGTCPTTGGDLGLVDAPAGASTMRVLQRQTVVVQ